MRGPIIGLAILASIACVAAPAPTPTPPPPAPTEAPAWPTPSPTAIPLPATPTQTPAPTPTSSPPTSTPVPPTQTPTPTPPLPAPTLVPPTPIIHYFRADVAPSEWRCPKGDGEIADPGDTIALEWSWSGGTGATIYHLLPSGQLGEPTWDAGPSGSLQYTIPPAARNYDRFILFLNDEDGLAAQETVRVTLRCPDEWFFDPAPDVCPPI